MPDAKFEVTGAKCVLGKEQQREKREKRREKREERRDHKKRPPENPKLTDSRVCWPLGRLESLHFCRVGGLEAS